ncbi:MAG: SPFH domain-containing protein [Planctomycetes bacterium]|nr:SPFH domain-containing protein [Planctomycetota bacterium]MCB9910797.1 SPFH domain-containing protein [Planctomycetota bacterium]MCB9912824.1 SPFH domain-containing protein [Planctomycetota bacterium]HPF15054.1 SPFH domain-containing protein [Planctomycetota bacterium]HRV81775.1 SPFH domain-containing protein [Planctomycetota bacterium]
MRPRSPRSGTYSRPPALEAPKPRPAWRKAIEKILEESSDQLMVILFASVAALVRAMGIQIQTGHAGLLFHFGRATKVLDHGFRPLIPFFQQVKVVPIRSRTMDLPSQRIVNRDGLVYEADANLVYHIHDVRKAVIEIDNLQEGMLQMLTLGVQEVLRDTDAHSIRATDALSAALQANLTARLVDWGVTVDKAGFPTLSPSAHTLRITQLAQRIAERQLRYDGFRAQGHGSARALALVGTRRFPVSRTQRGIRVALAKTRVLRAQRALRRAALQSRAGDAEGESE